MNKWYYIHNYRRLAQEGRVQPLCCPDCGIPFTTRLDVNDEPKFQCIMCLKTITPGLDVWQQIKAVVDEHYIGE